jgi:uncharacterized membrane protein YphA (DoxX/SURF4 family)
MKTENSIMTKILYTENDSKIFFFRLLVGIIFISEGIQKFLFWDVLGPGRFAEIGFNHAMFWAYFTGAFEILGGLLILAGFLTRLASIPLLIIMITALITTKLLLLINRGFWTFMHEYRTDFALTVLLILLILYGGGKWSLDYKIFQNDNP